MNIVFAWIKTEKSAFFVLFYLPNHLLCLNIVFAWIKHLKIALDNFGVKKVLVPSKSPLKGLKK